MCGMEYRLKKGSVYEGKVEKVDFPNKATVWVTDEDGQKEKAIVKNAIPGQTVRFCVNKKRKGHCEGRQKNTVTRWSFHLVMSTRTDRLHSDFTNETACMILFRLQNVRLLMRITERFLHVFRIMQSRRSFLSSTS